MERVSLCVQLWLAKPSNGGPGKTKTRGGADPKGSGLRKGIAGSERGIALRQAGGQRELGRASATKNKGR